MTSYSPKVKEAAIFREIAQNVVNPLEIVREGLSNSIDADARNIRISIRRDTNGNFFVEISDDGKGMDIPNLHKFFNLGDSDKNSLGIGEKGLGTKSYYKSSKITVITQMKEGTAYKAVMDNPWAKLKKNEIPSYTIEEVSDNEDHLGTIIIIENYNVDSPERYFNYDSIRDYISWFTAGGSFKNLFANYTSLYKVVKNMQVAPRIFITDDIQNIKGEICGVHQFSQPQEVPKEDTNEPIYKRSVNYCRHFGPFHRETNINGEYVSVQIYGTVSGINCRKSICKLRQGETYKSRFGVYMAKDFIPFAKRTDLINDGNYHHYHILINSQNFELTADRNNLSNENELKIKWVLEQAKNIIDNYIIPLGNSGYFSLRKKEEEEHDKLCRIDGIQKSLRSICKLDNLLLSNIPIIKKPYCETQTILLLVSLMSNDYTKPYIKALKSIIAYLSRSGTDLICIDSNDKEVLVEVEYKLSNLFKHDHPIGTFNYVVCWDVDVELNRAMQLSGVNVVLINENNNFILKYSENKSINVIDLKQIVSLIITDQLKKANIS